MQRIWALTGFFVRSLLWSFSGVGLVIATLVYWLVLFNPQQTTPEAAYYVLVIAIFGAGMGFMATLLLAARANRADLYSWVVRLPSRVEYMTAVLLGAVIVTVLLQLLLAALATLNGPSLSVAQLIQIPPIWLSLLLLTSVLALHATDLATNGWSRVYVFGALALLLFAQSIHNATLRNFVNRLNRVAMSQGWTAVNDTLANYAVTLNAQDTNTISRLFGLVFWPFRAIAQAIINGGFTTTQALAPAILLLYAAVLFMLAADLFANKDLRFME